MTQEFSEGIRSRSSGGIVSLESGICSEPSTSFEAASLGAPSWGAISALGSASFWALASASASTSASISASASVSAFP